jgi:hypothetical protein
MQLTKRFLASQVLIIAALSEACIAATVAPTTRFQGTTAGVFTNNDAGVVNGIGTNSFSWGIGQPNRSNLTFAGGLFDVNVRTGYVYGPRARNDAEVFSLGSLSYYNGTITGGSGANSVQLNVTSSVTSPVGTNPATFPIPFTLINSSNTNDPIASADSVFLPRNLPPVVTQTPGNYPITLEVPGFGQTTGSGFSTLDKFFVLEDGTASASLLGRLVPACEPIVTGAVSVTPNGATMSAAFTPKFGLTTSQAASLCGYSSFNWYQLVTANPYPELFPKNGVPLKTPHIDPPLGGYDYQQATGGDDNLPFYWNEGELAIYDNGTTVSFNDTPSIPLLKPGEFVSFTTSLVGVLADYTWDTLYSFAWKSNYNGTAGGVSVIKNPNPEDPNSGTGGIFDVALDLNPEDIPELQRDLMEADGSRNASFTSVPGPLPALGIGMTFAWTRKLRRRIHSVNIL